MGIKKYQIWGSDGIRYLGLDQAYFKETQFMKIKFTSISTKTLLLAVLPCLWVLSDVGAWESAWPGKPTGEIGQPELFCDPEPEPEPDPENDE